MDRMKRGTLWILGGLAVGGALAFWKREAVTETIMDLFDRMNGPKWDRLLPEAKAKASQLVLMAQQQGLDAIFVEGWRSPADSARNIAAGTSKLADPLDSMHVWGAAFDIAFKHPVTGLPYWPTDTDPRWRELAVLGQSIGLQSGGLMWNWDWPHFQLPNVNIGALKNTYAGNFEAYLQDNGIA